jgi:hypothetical protein
MYDIASRKGSFLSDDNVFNDIKVQYEIFKREISSNISKQEEEYGRSQEEEEMEYQEAIEEARKSEKAKSELMVVKYPRLAGKGVVMLISIFPWIMTELITFGGMIFPYQATGVAKSIRNLINSKFPVLDDNILQDLRKVIDDEMNSEEQKGGDFIHTKTRRQRKNVNHRTRSSK